MRILALTFVLFFNCLLAARLHAQDADQLLVVQAIDAYSAKPIRGMRVKVKFQGGEWQTLQEKNQKAKPRDSHPLAPVPKNSYFLRLPAEQVTDSMTILIEDMDGSRNGVYQPRSFTFPTEDRLIALDDGNGPTGDEYPVVPLVMQAVGGTTNGSGGSPVRFGIGIGIGF